MHNGEGRQESKMRWIDMHCDTLSEIWRGNAQFLAHNGLCVDLERLKKAGAKTQFFACFVNASGSGGNVWEQAWKDVLEMTEIAHSSEGEEFHLVRDTGELEDGNRMNPMEIPAAEPEQGFPGICGILTVEEGGVLNGKIERLEKLYRRGIRLITLTWNYENCIGSPNSQDPQAMERGLKPFGIRTVERMNELGMIIDVSHLSDGGFWDCIRYSRTPIVASHSNARSLCPHPRNLTDEMLRALGNKGGVAGVNFYSAFLRKKDGTGESARAGLEDIVRHMRWMMDQAGEDAVALGTDFDGFEKEALPEKIRGVQDMDLLWEAMKQSGITSRQIDKIAYGNVSRIMKEVFSFQA